MQIIQILSITILINSLDISFSRCEKKKKKMGITTVPETTVLLKELYELVPR